MRASPPSRVPRCRRGASLSCAAVERHRLPPCLPRPRRGACLCRAAVERHRLPPRRSRARRRRSACLCLCPLRTTGRSACLWCGKPRRWPCCFPGRRTRPRSFTVVVASSEILHIPAQFRRRMEEYLVIVIFSVIVILQRYSVIHEFRGLRYVKRL